MPKRCAFGCPHNNSCHQFPHPVRNPERFKAWVHLVGGKLDSQDDYELYRKKVVCDIHFNEKDKNRNNRLNFLAVPSLHLHGKPDEIDTSEKVLLAPKPVKEESSLTTPRPTVSGMNFETDTSERRLLVQELLKPKSCSSTTMVSGKPDEIDTSGKVLLAPKPVEEEISITTSRPTVSGMTFKTDTTEQELCAKELLKPESCSSTTMTSDHYARIIASEHKYFQTRKDPMEENNTKRQQQQVPSLLENQLKATRKKVKNLQTMLLRLQKKNKSLESRLAKAEKITTDVLFNKITCNMTNAAKMFTKMQYTHTTKKPSGRRFTLEEKEFSLSLYKKSPTSYPLLAKYFTLPSTKSLKRLINKIEVE